VLNSKDKEYAYYIINVDFVDEKEDYVGFIKEEIPLDKLIIL
jgi:hypothetical protein